MNWINKLVRTKTFGSALWIDKQNFFFELGFELIWWTVANIWINSFRIKFEFKWEIVKIWESNRIHEYWIGLGFDQQKNYWITTNGFFKENLIQRVKRSKFKNVTHDLNEIMRDHRERLTKIDQIATKIAKPRIVIRKSPWSWRPLWYQL